MLVHKSATLALPLLLVLLAITPSAEAGCASTTNGSLLVPTGSHSQPQFNHGALHGSTIYFVTIHSQLIGKPFVLEPTPGTAVSVIDGKYIPDFDVAWYTSSDGYITKNAEPGPDYGDVPGGAAQAIVWLVNGPDFGNSDNKFPQAGFQLRIHCT